MSVEDFNIAADLLENSGQGDFEGKKPEDLIRRAENALGIEFPPSYREFLKRFGCGDINGREFYGIIDDNFVDSSVPNGIWLTLNERQSSQLPNSLVIIYAAGDGMYYAIDTSKHDERRESPIVAWHPVSKPGGKLEVITPDFGAFFRQMINEALGSTT